MGVAGDAARLVQQAQAGICFDPDDPAQMAESAQHLADLSEAELEQLGQNGASHYRDFLSRRRGVTSFGEVFSKAIDDYRQTHSLYAFLKRSLDLAISLTLLFVLFPAMAVTALLVAWKLGLPVLFKQKRVGYRGRQFGIYKFRSMTNQCDAHGHLLPDAMRLTKFGQLLRKLSLDELPQLINVLRGDLSLVGPRPLLPEYLPLYSDEQRKRHHVKPGISGWAQIHGRNAISWEERFRLDVWYVQNASIWLDLKILWRTAFKVFRSDGVSAEGHVTMEKFRGNQQST
jgi:sugar transferase EpsL